MRKYLHYSLSRSGLLSGLKDRTGLVKEKSISSKVSTRWATTKWHCTRSLVAMLPRVPTNWAQPARQIVTIPPVQDVQWYVIADYPCNADWAVLNRRRQLKTVSEPTLLLTEEAYGRLNSMPRVSCTYHWSFSAAFTPLTWFIRL